MDVRPFGYELRWIFVNTGTLQFRTRQGKYFLMMVNSENICQHLHLFSMQSEKCIKPYIDNCDLDQNSVVNAREWCHCFEKTDRPCAAGEISLILKTFGTSNNGFCEKIAMNIFPRFVRDFRIKGKRTSNFNCFTFPQFVDD